MSMSIVKDPSSNIKLILYNHIFAKTNEFSVNQLCEEVKQYHIDVSESAMRKYLSQLIDDGLIMHTVNGYIVAD